VCTWADVGIAVPYGVTGEARIPCPQCSAARGRERDACLSVSTAKGVWYCHYCGWRGSLSSRSQAPTLAPRPRPPAQPDERHRAALARVCAEALPLAAGDPVLTYLHQRGITLPLADLPATLRYHPHLPYRHESGQYTYHPAMVARVDDPSSELATLHRTYLTLDGHKAAVPTPKKMMSPAVPGATNGGAIRLYAHGETLAVAEGIETALAVRCATGLPVWATYSAGGMARLIVPDEVRLVVICADNDPAGLDAARFLARRRLAEQRRVKILIPDTPGADWADPQEVRHAG
jgi:putative DNA primase/helicase